MLAIVQGFFFHVYCLSYSSSFLLICVCIVASSKITIPPNKLMIKYTSHSTSSSFNYVEIFRTGDYASASTYVLASSWGTQVIYCRRNSMSCMLHGKKLLARLLSHPFPLLHNYNLNARMIKASTECQFCQMSLPMGTIHGVFQYGAVDTFGSLRCQHKVVLVSFCLFPSRSFFPHKCPDMNGWGMPRAWRTKSWKL